jgi:hypothetical protein
MSMSSYPSCLENSKYAVDFCIVYLSDFRFNVINWHFWLQYHSQNNLMGHCSSLDTHPTLFLLLTLRRLMPNTVNFYLPSVCKTHSFEYIHTWLLQLWHNLWPKKLQPNMPEKLGYLSVTDQHVSQSDPII